MDAIQISRDKASTGSQSLKIAYNSKSPASSTNATYEITHLYKTKLDANDAAFSVDVYLTDASKTFHTIFGEGEKETAFRVNFKGGEVYVLTKSDESLVYAGKWNANKWMKLKVESLNGKLNYYLDGKLIKSVPAITKEKWTMTSFAHNNASGDAYFDNVKYGSTKSLAVTEIQKGENRLVINPNPASEFINIKSGGYNLEAYKIYSSDGKLVLEGTKPAERISVSSLPKGVYILTAQTADGQSISSKFIKK